MAEQFTRTCDNCGADLTHDDGADAYYFSVRTCQIPNSLAPIRKAVYVIPPKVGGDFCSIQCLKIWAAEL